MIGDEKIAAKLKGEGPAQAFADLIQKMADKLDRDWEVQIDDGNENQKSVFMASKDDVKLILRRGDLVSTSGAGTHKIVVTQVNDRNEVEAHVYRITATDEGIYTPE